MAIYLNTTCIRYIAVYKPVEYSRMASDASSHSRRLATYIVPITLLAILFNVPKFLESRVSCIVCSAPSLLSSSTSFYLFPIEN